MPEVIDLDAARAARQEKLGEAPTVRFGGKVLTLPPELPVDFSFLTAAGDFKGGIQALFAEKDFALFWEQKPTMSDLIEFAGGVARAYGFVDAGESEASGTPSNGTGKRSRPTSKGSTRST